MRKESQQLVIATNPRGARREGKLADERSIDDCKCFPALNHLGRVFLGGGGEELRLINTCHCKFPNTRGMIMKNRNFQIRLPGCHKWKSLQINKAMPAQRGKTALSAPEIVYAQGRQSPLFLEKQAWTAGLSVQGQNPGYKISSRLAICTCRDQSNILASPFMLEAKLGAILETLTEIGSQGAGELNTFIGQVRKKRRRR